jgi:hypothetical protein
MRFSTIFAILVPTLTWSAAQAASVTVNFPDVGDRWADTTTMAHGILTVADPFTGDLTGKHSFVTGTRSDPALRDLVITHISGVMGIFNTQPAPVIDIFIGNAEVQTTLPCCGFFSLNFSVNVPPQLPPTQFPLSITYELDADTSPTDFIQFLAGAVDINNNPVPSSITLSGYYVPEPSTWAMMLLGFGGLGFLGSRRARGRATAITA